MHRWVGSLGGLLGVVTAIVSVFVAVRSSTVSEANAKLAEVKKERAQIDADKAEERTKVAVKLEEAATQKLALAKTAADKETERAALETTRANDASALARSETERANEAAQLAQETESKRIEVEKNLSVAEESLSHLQKESENLAKNPRNTPEQKAAAQEISTTAQYTFERRKTHISVYAINDAQEERAKARLKGLFERYSADVDFHNDKDARGGSAVVAYFRPNDQAGAELIAKGLKSTVHLPSVSTELRSRLLGAGSPRFQVWLRERDL